MSFAVGDFVRRALTKYKGKYIDTGSFMPVVQVMWTIGLSGAIYEGYHHIHLEELHAQAAVARKAELKEAHASAVKALDDHKTEIKKAEDFVQVSKSAIKGAQLHIKDLVAQQVRRPTINHHTTLSLSPHQHARAQSLSLPRPDSE
mmetsp:Transcript_3199/g.8485  ORF Transcript_3199/g.8485 Transcript_3199/m.8485 type:complete len:146 (+) Transcript_3199:162-599(+)